MDWEYVRKVLNDYYGKLEKIDKLQSKAIKYMNDPYTLESIYAELDNVSAISEVYENFCDNPRYIRQTICIDLLNDGRNLSEIARTLGYTPERIRQITKQFYKDVAEEVNRKRESN